MVVTMRLFWTCARSVSTDRLRLVKQVVARKNHAIEILNHVRFTLTRAHHALLSCSPFWAAKSQNPS